MTPNLPGAHAQDSQAACDADSLYSLVKMLRKTPRFFAGHDQEALQQNPTTLFWAAADNPLCGDSLTLAVCADGLDRDAGLPQSTTMRYAGYFCALCHAMAELVCLGHARGLTQATHGSTSNWYAASAHTSQPINVAAGVESLRLGVASRPSRQRCTELPLTALHRLGGKLALPDPEGKFTP